MDIQSTTVNQLITGNDRGVFSFCSITPTQLPLPAASEDSPDELSPCLRDPRHPPIALWAGTRSEMYNK